MSINSTLNKIEVLANAGDYDGALRLLEQTPMPIATRLAVLGTIEIKRGNTLEAEVHLTKALEIENKNILANGNFAHLLIQQKKIKRALQYAEIAHRALPKHESFAMAYIACLSDADRHLDAISVIAPITAQSKPKFNTLLTHSSLLRAAMRPEEAMQLLQRATHLYPNDPNAQKAIAEAYAELDPRIAKVEFDKVFATQQDSLPLRWNASFVELRIGNFRRGWELYEAGLEEKIGKIGRPLPAQVKTFKRITEFKEMDPNKWTIYSCEQGLGDQILFLSTLQEAVPLHSKSILVGEDRMVTLLQRSFPSIPVYTYGYAAGLSKQQFRINGVFPIGSLMKHFRSIESEFKTNRSPFLRPEQSRVEKYKALLRNRLEGRVLIGISWRGGYWERQKKTKSFEFEMMMKLAKEGIQFISLQYGDISEERAIAKRLGYPITFIDGIDFKKDIEGWFALACACDKIVSVSTALVHFAGAAGKRVELMLSEFQGPFIWGTDTGLSLPYQDVYIHRKAKEESVEEYMSRVRMVI